MQNAFPTTLNIFFKYANRMPFKLVLNRTPDKLDELSTILVMWYKYRIFPLS